jgi:signal recognition particle subunit SRP54
MFESLSDRLGGIFSKMRGRGTLSEDDVNAAMREIKVALLEADVALPVVKQFIENVKEEAIGQEVIKSITPDQLVVKIVNDCIIEMLGSDTQELEFATPPCAYLMVGLQGTGKTTSTAKIARWIKDKKNKKVLMASLDVARPAAQEQLRQLGEQTEIATLPIVEGQSPVEIANRAMDTARKEGYDLVILDTAGRLAINEELMSEVADIKAATNPVETILVADSMTGQDAVNTANAFEEKIGISGIMLTRVDGDARGGAALSMRAITGKPIKLIGVGEKWDEIEGFHPDRIASRILGMGDVVSLVEKAVEQVDQEDAEDLVKKFKKGQFDFNDMLKQIQQVNKMGGASSIMKMMPGLNKMAAKLEEAGMDDSIVKKQEAIILSMTPKERENPKIMNASRKKRIAAGSGSTIQMVNQLIKQQQQMQTVMKRLKKMGPAKMMGMMKSMMGGKDAEAMMQSMDPELLATDMAGLKDEGPLGANPFVNNGGGMPALPPGMDMGDMLGMPARGGSKKNRKKKGKNK